MNAKPWDEWIPGVLSTEQIQKLCQEKFIQMDDPGKMIADCSVDLTLSEQGWHLHVGSVKPFGDRYLASVLNPERGMAKLIEPRSDGTFLLKAKKTYVFRLRERLKLGKDSCIHGQATAKSSVGRIDVLARLIVDGMSEYECFDSSSSSGWTELFLEITPMNFNVRVKAGKPLSQLRLFYGKPELAEVKNDLVNKRVLRNSVGKNHGSKLSVDLSATEVGGIHVSAFIARSDEQSKAPIPLWEAPEEEKPDPCRYWRFWPEDGEPTEGDRRLPIKKEQFYLLRSKERIALPEQLAVYCRAMDETIGEMRIHYAGFVHPFFGTQRSDGQDGTPLIFEVRGHDVDVSLRHEETLASLTFYRMSEDAMRSEADDDGQKSPYDDQKLNLSKYFAQWPEKLELGENGHVRPSK